MKTSRTHWASLRAAELRRQADALPAPAAGDWRARKRHSDQLQRLQAEAIRFDGLAARFARAA